MDTNDEKDIEIGECSKNLEAFKDEDHESSNLMDSPEKCLEKKHSLLLPYEKQIFLDLIYSDALLICGRGISYDRSLLHILESYLDFANLILVINCSDWEEEYYRSHIEKKFIREVSNTATERERVYLEGGIQFISTRILIVDLIKNRVPTELITGIVVLRAHTVIEPCQETFALSLYRQKNKTGFIKAFSQSPESFTMGWSSIERVMRNLFAKRLFLMPRYCVTVEESLKPFKTHLIEFHIPMTPNMTKIQFYILDIMKYLVKEIKRLNRYIDLEEVTVENCVTKKFHKILQAQLDSVWHRLNSQTKLIIADLKILRNLIISTIYGDPVTSYNQIRKYRSTEYAMSNSGWTILDSAENLFKTAKDRVYNKQGEFEPENCPKWKALTEILCTEIQNKDKKPIGDPVKVLILCQDSKTCYQLKQFLMDGPEACLFATALRYEVPITNLSESYKKLSTTNIKKELNKTILKQNQNKKISNDENIEDKNSVNLQEDEELNNILSKEDGLLEYECFQDSYILTLTQNLNNPQDDSIFSNNTNISKEHSIFEPFPEMGDLDISAILSNKNCQPMIRIQTFKTEKEGAKGLDRILDDFRPEYIIMYHSNVTAIRQIEIYEARLRRKPENRTIIFFLFHSKTIEEQSYLTSLRREKEAFDLIITTKETIFAQEYEGRNSDGTFDVLKPSDYNNFDVWGQNQQSRKAGGQETNEKAIPRKIIIDMREFRSDLPCLLHLRKMEVIPLTISVGDYILTPEICVERKSISDLIGSLNSGRLYNQCIQMFRFYAKPFLLIEFDQNKPFHLQGKYMLSGVASSNEAIVQRLQLLTIHFPKLRLIWSPNPYATIQLFEELKYEKEEPNILDVAALGTDEATQLEVNNFNSNLFDFILRLPGINSKNIHKIMRNGGCIKELLKRSLSELSELCGSESDAKLLWDSLHVLHLPDKDKEPLIAPSSKSSMSEYSNEKSHTYFGKSRGRGGNKRYGRNFKKN